MHTLAIRSRLNLLKEALRKARSDFGQLVPPQDNAARETEMWLHATVIEMTTACVRLLESRIYSPMPVVLRVGYEALADQIALARNPRYIDHMGAASLREGLALPGLLNTMGSGILKTFLGAPGAREFLRTVNAEADEIEKRGGAKRDPEDKFKAAGIAGEYAMYRFISGPVHNDRGTLAERHVRRGAEGPRQLALFQVPDDADLANWLDLAIGNILRSCTSAHRRVREYQPYFERLSNLIDNEGCTTPRRAAHLEKYKGREKSRD